MNKTICVIMAGGKGERFWPLSRLKRPKQLLPISGDSPMIVETVSRISPIIPSEDVFVITNQIQKEPIEKLLPNVPIENIIGEPMGRNTAPCLAFAAFLTSIKYGDDTVMVILSADHYIKKNEDFCNILQSASQRASESDVLITIGLAPNRPDTGYGYIEVGEEMGKSRGNTLYKVNRFLEKPDIQTAEQFLEKGNYLWNSGMFVWRTETILKAFKKYQPDMYNIMEKHRADIEKGDFIRVLENCYPKMDRISIDYAIMEKAPNVEVIPADIGWDDVGSWLVLERLHQSDENGNITLLPNLSLDTTNTIIAGEVKNKIIATLGINNLVIVDTPDALLVASKDKLDDIKKLVKHLERSDETKNLT